MTRKYRYEIYAETYRKLSPDRRAEYKAHYLNWHRRNLESGREDLIIFSEQILAQIANVDNENHAA